MRRRLAVFTLVASVILGGVVSISSPFGVGLVVIRRPIVLLQDAAERVVRALLGRRGTSGPDQTGASHPAAASVAANAGPEILITVELPADAAARLTLVRRGARRAEHDGHEAADRRQSQTQAEDDPSGTGHNGTLRIAGRDQGDADATVQERPPISNPNDQQSAGAAPPPGDTSANDGSAGATAPSVGTGDEDRGNDGPGRNEPGHGGEHRGGDHRDDDHQDRDRDRDRDRDKDDKGRK